MRGMRGMRGMYRPLAGERTSDLISNRGERFPAIPAFPADRDAAGASVNVCTPAHAPAEHQRVREPLLAAQARRLAEQCRRVTRPTSTPKQAELFVGAQGRAATRPGSVGPRCTAVGAMARQAPAVEGAQCIATSERREGEGGPGKLTGTGTDSERMGAGESRRFASFGGEKTAARGQFAPSRAAAAVGGAS